METAHVSRIWTRSASSRHGEFYTSELPLVDYLRVLPWDDKPTLLTWRGCCSFSEPNVDLT